METTVATKESLMKKFKWNAAQMARFEKMNPEMQRLALEEAGYARCGICATVVESILELAHDRHVCTKTLKQAYAEAWAGTPIAPPVKDDSELRETKAELFDVALNVNIVIGALESGKVFEFLNAIDLLRDWQRRWNDKMTAKHLNRNYGKKAS
jgi:hypothetical protein